MIEEILWEGEGAPTWLETIVTEVPVLRSMGALCEIWGNCKPFLLAPRTGEALGSHLESSEHPSALPASPLRQENSPALENLHLPLDTIVPPSYFSCCRHSTP